MTDVSDLESAAKGWLGKAAIGIDDPAISGPLMTAEQHVQSALRDIKSEGANNADAIHRLAQAEAILTRLQNEDMWPEGHYYRCIYHGGNGGGYESGFYNGTPVNNTPEALALLKELAYEGDPVL